MKPVVSICIPTYNRADYLRDALESIRMQLSDVADAVEVVIADNASVDNTKEVVEEFKNSFVHFVYIQNPNNVGFDKNVDIVVRAAHGEYCWYLGDDDALVHGALSHIVHICRQNKYEVISVTDRPLVSRPIDNPHTTYSSDDHIDGLTPSENYIRGYLPSALSMLIFCRSSWLTTANFSDHTPGWYYFETILKMAANPSVGILHVKNPMILTGQDMRWADNGEGLKIFIDCNRFLHNMLNWGYERMPIEQEIKENAHRFPIVLLQAKSRGLPMTVKNLTLVRSFTAPLKTKVVSTILFFIPNPIVRFTRAFKKLLV